MAEIKDAIAHIVVGLDEGMAAGSAGLGADIEYHGAVYIVDHKLGGEKAVGFGQHGRNNIHPHTQVVGFRWNMSGGEVVDKTAIAIVVVAYALGLEHYGYGG